MAHRSLFGLVPLLAMIHAVSGCSGSRPFTADHRDAGSDDAPKCVAPDAEVSSQCAATYDEQIEAVRGKCTQLGWARVYTYSLGGFLVYRRPGDLWPGATCAYDEGTGVFAGYEYCNDTSGPDGCFCRRVGRLPTTDAGGSAGTLVCASDGGFDSDQ